MLLILTTPAIQSPPQGYSLIKTISATRPLPKVVRGPMDNPALKAIIQKARKQHADALLNFTCRTNGREIGCVAEALKHDFSKPHNNVFNQTAAFLFGQHFVQNPVNFPKHHTVGKHISVTFFVPPKHYRIVAGESVRKHRDWWGLKKTTQMILKPAIPALCIDALHFMKAQTAAQQATGLVNFNCFGATSDLPGYVQVLASGNVFNG